MSLIPLQGYEISHAYNLQYLNLTIFFMSWVFISFRWIVNLQTRTSFTQQIFPYSMRFYGFATTFLGEVHVSPHPPRRAVPIFVIAYPTSFQ